MRLPVKNNLLTLGSGKLQQVKVETYEMQSFVLGCQLCAAYQKASGFKGNYLCCLRNLYEYQEIELISLDISS